MRLSQRLSLAQLGLIGTIVLAYGAVQLSREVRLFERDTTRDHHVTGSVLSAALTDLWRQGERARAFDLVEDANRNQEGLRIEWVPLDPAGVRYPGGAGTLPPSAAKWTGPLREGREVVCIEKTDRHPGERVTYFPVRLEDRTIGALRIAESLSEERGFVRSSSLHVLGTTILVFLAAILISLFLGSVWIVRPIELLGAQARRIGAGDLSVRERRHRHDEIGELAREMDRMAEQLAEGRAHLVAETGRRIAMLDQLRHADRLATVGTLASGIAHELGTPLNVVSGRARMIETGAARPEEVAENARIIREQSERITGTIRQLLDFSRRGGAPETTRADLREIAGQTLGLLGSYAGKRNVSLRVDPAVGTPVWIRVDPERIKQVAANLVLNAIQAMPEGGEVTVAVERSRDVGPSEIERRSGEFACLTVRDQGCGIAPESLPRLFDPFYTTKGVGEGTGLGLSISYGIVRDYAGWIGVESAPGRGSAFRVYLPCEEEPCGAVS